MNCDEDEIVCYCSNITKKQILASLNNGAKTLDDIRRITGACTIRKCKEKSPTKKCCSPIIREIIEKFNRD